MASGNRPIFIWRSRPDFPPVSIIFPPPLWGRERSGYTRSGGGGVWGCLGGSGRRRFGSVPFSLPWPLIILITVRTFSVGIVRDVEMQVDEEKFPRLQGGKWKLDGGGEGNAELGFSFGGGGGGNENLRR